MPKKKQQEVLDYFVCEEVETPDGTLVIGIRRNFMEVMANYRDKLLLARGIPIDTQNVNPRDPYLSLIKNNMPWLTTQTARNDYLLNHYQTQGNDAREEAIILAMFADRRNTFNVDPTDYEEEEVLPGTEDTLPQMKKNLANPLERRLKQIVDAINAHSEILQPAMDRIMLKIGGLTEEKDEDGFHPGSTD